MAKGDLTPTLVDRFIKGKMNAAIRRDLLNHKMLRESDLESCVYYHLRKFLRRDRNWRVFTRRFWRAIGRYPDVTILEKYKPRFALELKWREQEIPEKDRDTLGACLDQHKHFKVRFITTVVGEMEFEKLQERKRRDEKHRLREIAVNLGLSPRAYAKWWGKRQAYKRAFD